MDFLKVITIVLFIFLTIFTIRIHPEMHQPMIIEDENFQLTRISDTISTKDLSVAPTTKTKIVNNENIQEKTVEVKQQIPVASETKYIQQEPQRIKRTENKITHQNIPSQDTSQLELLQRIIKQTEQEKPIELEKPVDKAVTKPHQVETKKNPYMTEQEEIIAWNKWRSNLQNQIMRDAKIDYAPLGTLFSFTFVVDKFGNISNIKVLCSNPNYMEDARTKVKPAIANLQRKPILKFPLGSQRTSTVVIGGFIMRTEERYSTPEQFSDYERITY